MKMNLIQFQACLSLSQFLANYGTERLCEIALENSRRPQGFQYPKCKTPQHSSY